MCIYFLGKGYYPYLHEWSENLDSGRSKTSIVYLQRSQLEAPNIFSRTPVHLKPPKENTLLTEDMRGCLKCSLLRTSTVNNPPCNIHITNTYSWQCELMLVEKGWCQRGWCIPQWWNQWTRAQDTFHTITTIGVNITSKQFRKHHQVERTWIWKWCLKVRTDQTLVMLLHTVICSRTVHIIYGAHVCTYSGTSTQKTPWVQYKSSYYCPL